MEAPLLVAIDSLIAELERLMVERRRITNAILEVTSRLHGSAGASLALGATAGGKERSTGARSATAPTPEASLQRTHSDDLPPPRATDSGRVPHVRPRRGTVRSHALAAMANRKHFGVADLATALYGNEGGVAYRRAASLLTMLQAGAVVRRTGRGVWEVTDAGRERVKAEGLSSPAAPIAENTEDEPGFGEAVELTPPSSNPFVPSEFDEQIIHTLALRSPLGERDIALAVTGDITPNKRQAVSRRLYHLQRAALLIQLPDGRWAPPQAGVTTLGEADAQSTPRSPGGIHGAKWRQAEPSPLLQATNEKTERN